MTKKKKAMAIFKTNITITILSNTLTKTVGLPTRASDEMRSCLLRVSSNDWLSPTDRFLGHYGVGLRGDSHPISLFISRAWAKAGAAGEPLFVFP